MIDFFYNVINVEIIKLMEIYSVFWDKFILIKLLYSLLGLSKNSLDSVFRQEDMDRK